jgi:hypothetical protein
MTTLGLNSDRIRNALTGAAKSGTFYKKVIDPTTGNASTGTETEDEVEPDYAHANEVHSTFITGKNRRTLSDDRDTWTWELRLGFPCEVALELFEEEVTVTPIALPRDPDAGFDRQVILRLRDARPTHPPEQQPSTGTRVTYTFEATLSPVR